MKLTIRGILAATLLIAIGLHSARRWQRIQKTRREIESLQLEIGRQSFDAPYVLGHTLVCERAIEANPLPSPYFVAAREKHAQLFAEDERHRQ